MKLLNPLMLGLMLNQPEIKMKTFTHTIEIASMPILVDADKKLE